MVSDSQKDKSKDDNTKALSDSYNRLLLMRDNEEQHIDIMTCLTYQIKS